MNKVIKNKQVVVDEDTGWKFRGDEVPGRDEGLSEILSYNGKGERWDLIPGE